MATLESEILGFLLLPVVNERVARSVGTAYFSFLFHLCTFYAKTDVSNIAVSVLLLP